MRKKSSMWILLLIIVAAAAIYIDYYNYRQVMDTVKIVHYITGSGSGYSTVYLTAIVPVEHYSEDKTVEAIKRYVICRNKKMPDTLQIVLYDSMEKLSSGESYFEVIVHSPD